MVEKGKTGEKEIHNKYLFRTMCRETRSVANEGAAETDGGHAGVHVGMVNFMSQSGRRARQTNKTQCLSINSCPKVAHVVSHGEQRIGRRVAKSQDELGGAGRGARHDAVYNFPANGCGPTDVIAVRSVVIHGNGHILIGVGGLHLTVTDCGR